MNNKEKINNLSLCLGVCMGFMSRHNLYDKFKEEHHYVMETLSKTLYPKKGNRANGGYVTAAKLTPEEKTQRAKNAANTRWGNNETSNL